MKTLIATLILATSLPVYAIDTRNMCIAKAEMGMKAQNIRQVTGDSYEDFIVHSKATFKDNEGRVAFLAIGDIVYHYIPITYTPRFVFNRLLKGCLQNAQEERDEVKV